MMGATLTKEQLESLNYRRERLDAQMARLSRWLSGSGQTLLPLVRTQSGAHSERGTWNLIEALLEALEAAEGRPLPEAERGLFRSFLYCAIRISEERPWWLTEANGSFHDILRFGESLRPGTQLELYYMELYHSLELDGFFGCMDELYWLFSGNRIEDTLHEGERRQVRMLHPEEAALLEEARKENVADQIPADLDGLFADEDDYEQMEREAQRAWVSAFADKEILCREYLRFRTLYFDTAHSRFPTRLRQMLDAYLAGQGLSLLLNDDVFFQVYTQLDEIARRLRDAPSGEG